MFYCKTMLDSVRIYTSDKFWNQILTDLGANLVDSPNFADVNFDNIDVDAPISVIDLENIILNCCDNVEIIKKVFGKNIILPRMQHKIIVLLYKNPNINMRNLKKALGLMPDITTHAVENAIYTLRKTYGREFIINENGKYRIGKL